MKKLTHLSVLSALSLSTLALAQDRILVLSGGANPASNHYSQFLQTNTLTKGLRARRGDQVSVRFGAGNNETDGQRAADVHKVHSENGVSLNEMIFGKIDGNQPATKSEVNHYFSSLNGLEDKDTFYLFVSDHGMPNDSAEGYENNCINLWNYNAKTGNPGSGADSCLSREELQHTLSQLPAQRKVFVMSQCFSGGFHQMSVSAEGGYPKADPHVCGFTAVTEDTTASGCTPDVDGPGYKGYERFFTQQVTGTDVVSGQPMSYAAKYSLSDAHLAAALEDTTKDIPLRTSDYYLLQWAKLLETRGFTPRTQSLDASAARAAYQAGLASGAPQLKLDGLPTELKTLAQAKLDYLQKTVALLSASDTESAAVYADSSEARLLAGLTATRTEMAKVNYQVRSVSQQLEEPSSDVEEAWANAVVGGKVPNLSEDTRKMFEPFIAQNGADAGLFELAFLQLHQPDVASAFGKYYSTRSSQMQEWARKSQDEDLASAQRTVDKATKALAPLYERFELLERRYDNYRRVLFTRQQLSALATLGELKDEKAFQDLKGLLSCESASL